jgi:hypothetical protein
MNSPWGLAKGAIIKAKRGGVWANIGEGRHDEAVVPLPKDWRSSSIGASEKKETHLHFHGDLSFPNIKSGSDAEELIKQLELLAKD